MKKITLKINGMRCASCAANITRDLKKQSGLVSAEVSFAAEKARIEYDEKKIDLKKIKETIKTAGYEAADDDFNKKTHEHGQEIKEQKRQKKKVIASILLTLPLASQMIWEGNLPEKFLNISLTRWLFSLLAFFVVFIFGRQFHLSAFKQLKKLRFNMDSLISLGTLAAFFYSFYALLTNGRYLYFDSAAAITSLILLGKYLELKTKGRANEAMKKLLELGAKKARLLDARGREIETGIDKVKINDIILVKPGEKIPLDGLVLEGESSVNEAMISGESLPPAKAKGAKVFGATINQTGVLKIKVTQIGEDTFLAQIIKTVEEAQNFKAPLQKLADRIAGVFVPTVISIALLTFAGWYFLKGDFALSLINAVAVLVIACPCALGLATPLAVMAGANIGARRGILIKNGESFEKAKKADTIIFDKTGTLTKGKPKAQSVLINSEDTGEKLNETRKKIIAAAAGLAANSAHPLSKAVAEFYPGEKNHLELKKIKELAGRGLKAEQNNVLLLLGNKQLLAEHEIKSLWLEKILTENQASGGTIIFFASDKKVLAAFLIADEIRETARRAVKEVINLNLRPLMITGDNQSAAKRVAKLVGLKNYLAEILPTGKQKEVKKIQAEGRKVIFVGDGLNDAPALAQADLGIAMGSGADIAKETGDIIIMKNDPLEVAQAIKLAQKTFKIIKENLFWAFFYNVLAIPLAISGAIKPTIAAAAMGLSSLTVIGNSLRIRRGFDKKR